MMPDTSHDRELAEAIRRLAATPHEVELARELQSSWADNELLNLED